MEVASGGVTPSAVHPCVALYTRDWFFVAGFRSIFAPPLLTKTDAVPMRRTHLTANVPIRVFEGGAGCLLFGGDSVVAPFSVGRLNTPSATDFAVTSFPRFQSISTVKPSWLRGLLAKPSLQS